MSVPGVSVIVCCYNSEAVIRSSIQSIAAQQLNAVLNAEVVLVDNNCTDGTVAIAKESWSEAAPKKITFRVIEEKKPGLSHARKAGLHAARYQVIVFCDDDNRLAGNYLENSFILLQNNLNIGAAGGTIEGITDDEFPAWWPQYAHAYAVGRQGEASGDISSLRYLWGAGLVVRKNILETVLDDGFPLLLSDRKGNVLSSGGDSEICARIVLMGYRLWFDDTLQLDHYIHGEKLTETYRKRLYEGHDAAAVILEKYRRLIIEKKLSGIARLKRFISLALSLIFQGKDTDYNKAALNIIAHSEFKVDDRDYAIISGFLKWSAGR